MVPERNEAAVASHVVDMATLGGSFGSPAMRQIWDESNRLRQQLRVEGALALAEADLGMIPSDAAQSIATAAEVSYDLTALAEAARTSMHSLNATVVALQHQAGGAGEWVHYGVTTQDVVDTGLALQLAQAYDVVHADTLALARHLKRLAAEHRDTVMAGRTHFIQALPTTFGFKVAVWLDEMVRHLARLDAVRDEVRTGNINGAVGTYSAFAGQGRAVEKATLERLGLNAPRISWQASRDRIYSYAGVLGGISASVGKIATALTLLMQTEVGEVAEPYTAGKIGSTTMPHKRNPALLEGVAALTAPVQHARALIGSSMQSLHERDAISWRAEWVGIPEIHLYLDAQLVTLARILDGLVVDSDRMRRNLDLLGGLVMSEHVMFQLGRAIGKQTAHHVVYEAAMRSAETGEPFAEVLLADERVTAHADRAAVESWLEPTSYLGEAGDAVDAVLAAATEAGV